jgi:hypothetical protein
LVRRIRYQAAAPIPSLTMKWRKSNRLVSTIPNLMPELGNHRHWLTVAAIK